MVKKPSVTAQLLDAIADYSDYRNGNVTPYMFAMYGKPKPETEEKMRENIYRLFNQFMKGEREDGKTEL